MGDPADIFTFDVLSQTEYTPLLSEQFCFHRNANMNLGSIFELRFRNKFYTLLPLNSFSQQKHAQQSKMKLNIFQFQKNASNMHLNYIKYFWSLWKFHRFMMHQPAWISVRARRTISTASCQGLPLAINKLFAAFNWSGCTLIVHFDASVFLSARNHPDPVKNKNGTVFALTR